MNMIYYENIIQKTLRKFYQSGDDEKNKLFL